MTTTNLESLKKARAAAGRYAYFNSLEYPCPTVLEKINQHMEFLDDFDDDSFILRGDKCGILFVGDIGSGKTFGMWKFITDDPDYYFDDNDLTVFSGLSLSRFFENVSKGRVEATNRWEEIFEGWRILFIDDLPQASVTPRFLRYFFDLLEGLNSGKVSEILINSQYDVDTLCQKWAKASPSSRDIVAGISRRLKECFKGYLLKDEREKV